MSIGKMSRSLWIIGWFAGLLTFNIASHWSQNADKNGLFIFLEALGRLTSPVELLLSAAVVYGVRSSGASRKPDDGNTGAAKRKAAVRTAFILVGTLVGVLVIGFVAASWHGGGPTKGEKPPINPRALDNYALLSKSTSELGTEDDGLSPDAKKRMREGLALQLAGAMADSLSASPRSWTSSAVETSVSEDLTAKTSSCFFCKADQTASARSPIPFSVTSSRAIAMRMSSSSLIACNPSEENLPSMANDTSSFLPISRRQLSCIVSA